MRKSAIDCELERDVVILCRKCCRLPCLAVVEIERDIVERRAVDVDAACPEQSSEQHVALRPTAQFDAAQHDITDLQYVAPGRDAQLRNIALPGQGSIRHQVPAHSIAVFLYCRHVKLEAQSAAPVQRAIEDRQRGTVAHLERDRARRGFIVVKTAACLQRLAAQPAADLQCFHGDGQWRARAVRRKLAGDLARPVRGNTRRIDIGKRQAGLPGLVARPGVFDLAVNSTAEHESLGDRRRSLLHVAIRGELECAAGDIVPGGDNHFAGITPHAGPLPLAGTIESERIAFEAERLGAQAREVTATLQLNLRRTEAREFAAGSALDPVVGRHTFERRDGMRVPIGRGYGHARVSRGVERDLHVGIDDEARYPSVQFPNRERLVPAQGKAEPFDLHRRRRRECAAPKFRRVRR